MSTHESWRNRANLHGLDNLNALDRWRADNARREEEFTHQRQAEERERQRREESNTADQLRAEVQQELANLRAEMHQQHEVHIEATGEAIGEFSNKTIDHVEKLIREMESQLFVTIERRFGELMGRLDAIAPDTRSRSKGFKFSNERDDDGVIDMPNPLRKAMN
jgi:DNA anti-recombination protein RmuC